MRNTCAIKKWALALFVALLLMEMPCTLVNAEEGRTLPRVVDDADILTENEERELQSLVDEISERQACDVVVITKNSLDGAETQAYADDFYDYNGYGFGEDKSGILLLIAMEVREWQLSTCGYGVTAFTDAGMEYMEEQFVSYLSDGAYMDAFVEYAELCDDFITQAKTGEPYDSGNLPRGSVSVFWIPVDLLIGVLIAFLFGSFKKSKLKSVKKQTAAREYAKAGSLMLTVNVDRFVNCMVTTRVVAEDHGSSGSSVHTSFSGTKHGGSGGSF